MLCNDTDSKFEICFVKIQFIILYFLGILSARSIRALMGLAFLCQIYEPFSHFVVILWLLCHIYEPFSHLVSVSVNKCQ